MKNSVLAAVSSERIIQTRLSVVVTEDCVIIPSFSGQPHTVLSLDSISRLKVVKTYHPTLAVIAVGLFLLAAAALASKDGAGTGIPIGVIGFAFLLAYLVTQKGRVAFVAGSDVTQSVNGSFFDVADLMAAVIVTRRNLLEMKSEKLIVPGFFARVGQWVNGLMNPRVRTEIL